LNTGLATTDSSWKRLIAGKEPRMEVILKGRHDLGSHTRKEVPDILGDMNEILQWIHAVECRKDDEKISKTWPIVRGKEVQVCWET